MNHEAWCRCRTGGRRLAGNYSGYMREESALCNGSATVTARCGGFSTQWGFTNTNCRQQREDSDSRCDTQPQHPLKSQIASKSYAVVPKNRVHRA